MFRVAQCIFIGVHARTEAYEYANNNGGSIQRFDKALYIGESTKKVPIHRTSKEKDGWHAIHSDGTLRRYAYSTKTKTLVQCKRILDLTRAILVEKSSSELKFTQDGVSRSFAFNGCTDTWYQEIQREIAHWKAITIQKMFRGFFQRKKKAQTIEYLNDVYAIRLTNDDNAEVECPIYNNAHGTLFVCQNIAESEIDDLKVSLQYAEEDIEDLNWLTSPQRYMRLANEIQSLKRRVSTPMAMGKIVLKERDALFCELSINISVTNGDYDFDLEFSEDDDGTIYCYDIDGCYWEMTLLNKNI